MKQFNSFGAWLKDKRAGMPLRAFAEKVGVDAGTISRTERDCTDVLVPTVVRICRGLGLSLTSFFLDWQGLSFSGIYQFGEAEWQGALTGQDVQYWLLRLLSGQERSREMLISVLNLIDSQETSKKKHVDLPGIGYEVAPPLHCASVLASLMSIYQHGGLILPSELGAYVGMVREQKGFSLDQLSFASRIRRGTLSSIENGTIQRLKLFDLIDLDDSLQCGGELIALYWWEVSSRQILEQEWNQRNLTKAYSPQVLHQLLSLLISVGRWLQVIYQEDTIWQSTIRYQLGIPTSYEKKQAV